MRKCTAKVQGAKNLKHALQALYDVDPEAAAKDILLSIRCDSESDSDSESDASEQSPDESSDSDN